MNIPAAAYRLPAPAQRPRERVGRWTQRCRAPRCLADSPSPSRGPCAALSCRVLVSVRSICMRTSRDCHPGVAGGGDAGGTLPIVVRRAERNDSNCSSRAQPVVGLHVRSCFPLTGPGAGVPAARCGSDGAAISIRSPSPADGALSRRDVFADSFTDAWCAPLGELAADWYSPRPGRRPPRLISGGRNRWWLRRPY